MTRPNSPPPNIGAEYWSPYGGVDWDTDAAPTRGVSSSFQGAQTVNAPLWRAPPHSAVLAVMIASVDTAAIGVAGLLSLWAADGGNWPEAQVRALAIAILLTVLFGWIRGAYYQPLLYHTGRQLRAVLPAFGAGWALALLVAYTFAGPHAVTPEIAVTVVPFAVALLGVVRFATATVMGGRYGWQIAPRAVILSDGPESAPLIARLVAYHKPTLRLVGVVDDKTGHFCLPYLGPTDEVFNLVRRNVVDRVLIAKSLSQPQAVDILRRLADYAVETSLVTERTRYLLSGRSSDGFGEVELIHLFGRPIGGWRSLEKAVEDYLFASIALLAAAVPMMLIALAIRLESPGPVLFRQRRTGFNNRDFFILKFRTMYDDTTDHDVAKQVRKGDARVTRVGRLLRQTSLDELPQLFNIFRGEMSFVGPRPHAPTTRVGARLFAEALPRYAARHRVKPGLTGLAQVRGWRGATDREEQLVGRVESDLEYIESWSLWLDLAIVVRTLVAVCRMRNAY